jgi:hypothetical protein
MTSPPSSAVIAFPTDRVRRATPGAAPARSGEVVIFSGVRIERITDEPRTIAKATLPARKRGERR